MQTKKFPNAFHIKTWLRGSGEWCPSGFLESFYRETPTDFNELWRGSILTF